MPGLTGLSGISGSSSVFGQNAAPAPFAPTDLVSLVGFYKSDAGLFEDAAGTTPATDDGDVIGQQADQSGAGNNLTQATTGNKPTLQNAAGDLINGLPVVKYDGIDDVMATAAALVAGSFTVAATLKMTNSSVRTSLWSQYTAGTLNRCIAAAHSDSGGVDANDLWVFIDNGATDVDIQSVNVIDATSVWLVTWTKDGTNSVRVRVNGVQVGEDTTNIPAVVQNTSFQVGTVALAGPISTVDIVVCTAALTGADLDNLEDWMADRVGLVI